MTEEVQQTESPAPESSEPSLEDVYKTYNVSEPQPEQRQQYQAPPQQEQRQQQPFHVPDPALDPDGYKQWAQSQHHTQEQIRHALQAVAGEITQFKASQIRAKEEADIKEAVSLLTDKVPDIDPDYAEIAIAAQARKDPKFMALWQSREKNPQAWKAGVKALSGKLASKLAMRQDPQVTENLRAAKQSQQSQATAAPEDDEQAKMGKMSPKELDKYLNKFRSVA